jgi:hypothetical protein
MLYVNQNVCAEMDDPESMFRLASKYRTRLGLHVVGNNAASKAHLGSKVKRVDMAFRRSLAELLRK